MGPADREIVAAPRSDPDGRSHDPPIRTWRRPPSNSGTPAAPATPVLRPGSLFHVKHAHRAHFPRRRTRHETEGRPPPTQPGALRCFRSTGHRVPTGARYVARPAGRLHEDGQSVDPAHPRIHRQVARLFGASPAGHGVLILREPMPWGADVRRVEAAPSAVRLEARAARDRPVAPVHRPWSVQPGSAASRGRSRRSPHRLSIDPRPRSMRTRPVPTRRLVA